jgi:hypothetical protein
MATTRYVNGQPYLIPDQGDSYVWGTDLSNFFGAVSNSTLQKNGGAFTLSADADFGPNFGLKAAYLAARSATADSGFLRLGNTDTIQFRNAANSGNNVLSSVGDVLTYSGTFNAATVTGTFSGDGAALTNLSKAASGLGNVDNTSDANKPISIAEQAALNLKADTASPTFTGVPIAPTAVAGTSTNQIATTAYVQASASGNAPTGMFATFMRASAPAGWVAGDGTTIGNVGSGATRANIDTLALFTAWWTDYSNAQLPIFTSAGGASTRGASAAADWAALKRLTVFDVRGRFARSAGTINSVTTVNGTSYGDTLRDHTHTTASTSGPSTGGTTGLIITTSGAPQGGFTSSGASGGGLETSPASVGMLGCFKL